MSLISASLRLIVTIAHAAVPVYIFIMMFKADNPQEVILGGIFLLAALYLYGLVTALLYSGPAATSLVDFLLYPRRFLKKAPPILSHQQGLITRRRFEEAELELLEVRQNHKDSPETALMLADLHALEFHDLESAIRDCLFYFKHRSWRYNELNLPIVLRYADWQTQLGRPEQALSRLEKEAKLVFYPQGEKKTLLLRAESLREQFAKE